MIRFVLAWVFALTSLQAFSTGQELLRWEVGGETYIFQEVSAPNDVCCKDFVFLKIYRKESTRQKLLLTFPLYRSYADGHYEEVELGKFRTEGNELHLFTWWNFRGEDNAAPVGAKKMVYEVREDGRLYWKSGQIYLEEGSRGEGAGFLKYETEDAEDRKKFKSYISEIEKKHLARFVYGANSDNLFEEVRVELKEEIEKVKASWF